MDKQKQIEEIAKIIVETDFYYRGFCWQEDKFEKCLYGEPINCQSCLTAKNIIEQGYRKIPENVVLTREELDKKLEPFRLEIITLSQELVETSQKLMKARKETAEKFAERLKYELTDIIPFEDYEIADWEYDGLDIEKAIDEICKEITEGE